MKTTKNTIKKTTVFLLRCGIIISLFSILTLLTRYVFKMTYGMSLYWGMSTFNILITIFTTIKIFKL